jgi:hypothetical protein
MRPRAQHTGLLVRTVGDQVVVYDQRRQSLHVLNRTTALVWDLCDGTRTVADIAEAIAQKLDAAADVGVVELALAQLEEAFLLQPVVSTTGATEDLSRRQMLQRAAAVAVGVLLPSITSCGLPLAPDAMPAVDASADLVANITTTTSTTGTTPLFTTTTSTSPVVTTTTSTSTPLVTTTSTTTPLVTTTSTTTPLVTTTTTTSTTTTTPAPRKVRMCISGKTIMVDQDAVAGLLRAGATMGRCP